MAISFRGAMIAVALGLAANFSLGADVHAAVKDGQKFGDWTVSCAKERPTACSLVQRQAVQGGARLFQLTIGKVGSKGEMGASAVVPLGLHIPAGVVLVLDGAQTPMTLMRCVEAGCLAVLQFDAKIQAAIGKANDIQLAMIDDFSRQTVLMKVGVAGLADGLKAL